MAVTFILMPFNFAKNEFLKQNRTTGFPLLCNKLRTIKLELVNWISISLYYYSMRIGRVKVFADVTKHEVNNIFIQSHTIDKPITLQCKVA